MDLIGYDHFEVVGEMLENRLALVASVLENPALLAHDGVCVCVCVRVRVRVRAVGQGVVCSDVVCLWGTGLKTSVSCTVRLASPHPLCWWGVCSVPPCPGG